MVTHGNGGSEVQIYNTGLPTGAAIVQEIDENNNSTFFTYDANGYMVSVARSTPLFFEGLV